MIKYLSTIRIFFFFWTVCEVSRSFPWGGRRQGAPERGLQMKPFLTSCLFGFLSHSPSTCQSTSAVVGMRTPWVPPPAGPWVDLRSGRFGYHLLLVPGISGAYGKEGACGIQQSHSSPSWPCYFWVCNWDGADLSTLEPLSNYEYYSISSDWVQWSSCA